LPDPEGAVITIIFPVMCSIKMQIKESKLNRCYVNLNKVEREIQIK
jgi:hypothetical protein